MARSLSAISSIAWSQLTRVHWPLTSFIGYFRRRSPCTSSRTEAPLAQCEPRLIGESQPGSWPIHTPFATSATTVQPTEQCVQMFLRMVTCAPAGGGAAAAATVAPAPSVRRNSRRPSVVLRSRFIAVSSYVPSLPLRCSRGQRESIGFDLYKHPAEPSYSSVEIRGLGLFQIGEEAPDPRREMLLEQLAIGTGRSGEAAARKPCHDLAQNRRVLLRRRLARRPFEPH